MPKQNKARRVRVTRAEKKERAKEGSEKRELTLEEKREQFAKYRQIHYDNLARKRENIIAAIKKNLNEEHQQFIFRTRKPRTTPKLEQLYEKFLKEEVAAKREQERKFEEQQTVSKAIRQKKDADNSTVSYIGPQDGPQTAFLSSPADIVFYGGSAGGGKTYGLLLDPLRYVRYKEFGAVIFRRTFPEIKNEGGLWDESTNIYLPLGARPKETDLSWTFPSGSVISFAHLQHEKNIYSWQGAQVPYFGFDEITHFTARQFWYLLSRQRNVAGIPNLVRATCNPDPDSFVRNIIDWWIDQNGYAIPERSGVIRWFVRVDDGLVWADNEQSLKERYPSLIPRSFTFISAKLSDNQILCQKDPSYLATLLSLPTVDRKRLLDGNWNVRPSSGLYFKRSWFEVVDPELVPRRMMKIVRGWDLAGTPEEKDASDLKQPDATAGVKMGRDRDGNIWVLDFVYDRMTPMQVERTIRNCASQDGLHTIIRLPQDPGQAGKAQVAHFARLLIGHTFRTRTLTGDKVTRAGAFSSACEHGMVKLVKATWNELYLTHLEQFPPEVGSPDTVDASVEAYHELTSGGRNVKSISPISIRV